MFVTWNSKFLIELYLCWVLAGSISRTCSAHSSKKTLFKQLTLQFWVLLGGGHRLFRALVAGEDEEGALALLDKMQVCDLQDSDIQVIIRETLQPHYTAAAESAEAAESPETLPRVRRRVEELMSQD